MDGIVLLFVVGFLLVGVVLVSVMYQWYLGTTTFSAVILALLALGSGAGYLIWEFGTGRSPYSVVVRQRMVDLGLSHNNPIPGIAVVLLGLMVTALLAKLYLTWVQGKFILNENAAGRLGFRSWLRPVNIMIVVGIGFSLFWGLGCELSTIFVIELALLAALCAYPLSTTLSAGGRAGGMHAEQVPANSTSNLSTPSGGEMPVEREGELVEERRRVLTLVEAGKISGEDGAELISALGHSHAVSQKRVAGDGGLSRGRWFMLLGAAVLLVGFLLPWFEYRADIHSSMKGMNSIMGGDFSLSAWAIIRAGDIKYGLGWIILALGMGSAVLPLFWPAQRQTWLIQRNITLLGLGISSILLLYLLVELISGVGIGAILAVGGYVLLWVGAVREYLLTTRPMSPAVV